VAAKAARVAPPPFPFDHLEFAFRDDDIIIATYGKSGTT
jgi:hypothetical protein